MIHSFFMSDVDFFVDFFVDSFNQIFDQIFFKQSDSFLNRKLKFNVLVY